MTSEPLPWPAKTHKRAHTKIVATIGPASEDLVRELIDRGLSVARINFSHGTREEHERRIRKVREAAQDRMVSIGILCDLPGPKMRTASFVGGGVSVLENEIVKVKSGAGIAEPGVVLINVEGLLEAIEPGHRILVADGQVEIVAQEIRANEIIGRVRRGGRIDDRKGVHLPDTDVRYELPTAEDVELIEFAMEQKVDMLGISFVGHASEMKHIRELAPGVLLVAKIERLTALQNLDELLEASDGVMVARGDLGVEVELEQLPITQKSLISASVRAGKFAITATEMLESMISSTRPTRAEVTDVANAVLDGTDAVMLSAETAVGDYPVETVETMSRIALAIEQSQRFLDLPRPSFRDEEQTFSNALAMAAVQVTESLGIERIVCFTETGNTVRLISRYRPNADIVALSPNDKTVRHMTALANVIPMQFRREPSLEDMLYMAAEMLVVRELATYGDEVIFVAGVPPGVARSTNVIKLHRIGEPVKLA